MSALVDLLTLLQSAPRVPTTKGAVLIFDSERTRDLDDALVRLDAQMTAGLCNLDGFAQRPAARLDWRGAPPSTTGDGIQRGNSDLLALTEAQMREGHQTQGRG